MELGADWRVLDGAVSAWFDTGSMTQGAALAERVVEEVDVAAVDVRASGVRVRLGSAEQAEAVSRAARELGLSSDPSALQQVALVLESSDPASLGRFWQRVLGHAAPGQGWVDPLRRDPDVRLRESSDLRPLRNRLHLDVVRPAEVVAGLGLGEGAGPYGVRHADADGNEVDVVPGDRLAEGEETADWRVVFAAMACYRTTTPRQQADVVAAAAALADEAGFPLLLDVRPGLVVLDSGKDQADADAHGLDLDFAALAARLQAAARDAGVVADVALPRFVQLFLDAADVAAVQAFWRAALGWVDDRREGVPDLHDPRRLGPVLGFQPLDPGESERRAQRNRLHVELELPADVVATRLATLLEHGGRLLEEHEGRLHVADPEGNELVLLG